ncbi:shikimate 5-dehydrogenase [Leifsonia xyli subsp. cynodontis DSM 46306]|uniref:Shikimate 5-dehydrogenase n=1 Tax=Leifsonia xyli subsp. cynodontis DSM 46306 TaxID=1389489 RepID=U3P3I2_LEIXC|nr:shikimate 5-dehydrogenase [Leifsonia xyli subsp. cynodontis DSM 46306]
MDTAKRVLVRGSGGMAKAVVAAFRGSGFDDLTVFARNEQAGLALASRYGYRWVAGEPAAEFDVIVNVTPLGMRGADEDAVAFSETHIRRADTVFDVVAFPAETPLITASRTDGKSLITGAEVIALQAARQFERYTGVTLTPDQIVRASEFSRAE